MCQQTETYKFKSHNFQRLNYFYQHNNNATNKLTIRNKRLLLATICYVKKYFKQETEKNVMRDLINFYFKANGYLIIDVTKFVAKRTDYKNKFKKIFDENSQKIATKFVLDNFF